MSALDRRTLLGLGPIALAGCAKDNPYFGNTQPPPRQQLACAITATSVSLDPAQAGAIEAHIVRAIFEGLTNLHPRTAEPIAGIATHCETSPDRMRLTLFLRGHSHPRGVPLPEIGAQRSPVRWTDGFPVTAHDVVYSWRRVVDPATASMYAYLLHCIQNAQAITRGELSPQRLAVRALDDFSVQVDLRAPTPFFLEMLSVITLFPVPRLAIERVPRGRNEDSWTEPKNIVTSGPFTLREHRSRDRIVVERNPQYYDAPTVALEQVSFLLTQETTVGANLYKSGRAHLMPGFEFPPLIAPALSRKRDLCTSPAFGTVFPCFNTTKPPFDNVLVRYALNMAVNKQAIARVFGFGRQPARNLVPSLPGYRSPESVHVRVNGKATMCCNSILKPHANCWPSPDFQAAATHRAIPSSSTCCSPIFRNHRLRAEILQSEWQDKLSIRVNVNTQEFKLFLQNIYSLNYTGVTDNVDWGYYRDPTWFLDQFATGASANVTGWSDPRFDSMLAKASSATEPAARMEQLTECERYLLRAMPCVPLYHDVWAIRKSLTYVESPRTSWTSIRSSTPGSTPTGGRHESCSRRALFAVGSSDARATGERQRRRLSPDGRAMSQNYSRRKVLIGGPRRLPAAAARGASTSATPLRQGRSGWCSRAAASRGRSIRPSASRTWKPMCRRRCSRV